MLPDLTINDLIYERPAHLVLHSEHPPCIHERLVFRSDRQNNIISQLCAAVLLPASRALRLGNRSVLSPLSRSALHASITVVVSLSAWKQVFRATATRDVTEVENARLAGWQFTVGQAVGDGMSGQVPSIDPESAVPEMIRDAFPKPVFAGNVNPGPETINDRNADILTRHRAYPSVSLPRPASTGAGAFCVPNFTISGGGT